MRQEEFNMLMRNYYWGYGRKQKVCRHTPQELMLYRLSVVFNLGVICGVLVDWLY